MTTQVISNYETLNENKIEINVNMKIARYGLHAFYTLSRFVVIYNDYSKTCVNQECKKSLTDGKPYNKIF